MSRKTGLLLSSSLASLIVIGDARLGYAGTCAPAGGGYVCSGAANPLTDTSVGINATDISSTTTSGFGLSTTTGAGFNLVTFAGGLGRLVFDDPFNSDINGATNGIAAFQLGADVLSITSTGSVTGANGNGIRAGTLTSASSASLSAVDVSGSTEGIFFFNGGDGATSITTSGTVIGAGGNGIDVTHQGSTMEISTATVTGSANGIYARNEGTGRLSITSTGAVTGQTQIGIYAENVGNNGTDLNISTAAVTGQGNAIEAQNAGSGTLTVESSGLITSHSATGILANNAASGAALTITAVDVSGAASGISATNAGSGATTVTTSGQITAGTGAGITTDGLAGATAQITLETGSTVSATSGVAIADTAANTRVLVQTGAALTGAITLGNGSDTLDFAGGDFSGVTRFDGGDDSAAADGFLDRLVFSGGTGNLDGSKIENFEELTISGSAVITLSNNTLMIGDGTAGTGLMIDAGGTLHLTASATTLSALTNGGTLSLRNNMAGDRAIVSGTFASTNGSVILDVVLGDDTSLADVLEITGDASGTTNLTINNLGGTGAQTVDGIVIVEVAGTSTASFLLNGTGTNAGGDQVITVGAYEYALVEQADGDIALASVETPVDMPPEVEGPAVEDQVSEARLELSTPANAAASTSAATGAPAFEAAQSLMLALKPQSSFRTRLAGRVMAGVQSNTPLSFASTSGSALPSGEQALWFQIEGSNDTISAANSTSNVQDIKTDAHSLTVGLDFALGAFSTGTLLGGVNLFAGGASSEVRSTTGANQIDTNFRGIGLTATWLGNAGYYADGQLQYTRMSSDIDHATSGRLATGVASDRVSAAVEFGRAFAFGADMILTPQVQLGYSKLDTESFASTQGAQVSYGSAKSKWGRLGVSLDKVIETSGGEGTIYGVLSVNHEFETSNAVALAGNNLSQDIEDTSVALGIGGAMRFADSYTVSGSLDYSAGLGSFSDSHSLRGTVGLRIEF